MSILWGTAYTGGGKEVPMEIQEEEKRSILFYVPGLIIALTLIAVPLAIYLVVHCAEAHCGASR